MEEHRLIYALLLGGGTLCVFMFLVMLKRAHLPGTGASKFFGRRNAFLTIGAMNAAVLAGAALLLIFWYQDGQNSEIRFKLVGIRMADTIFASAIALCCEAAIVVALCAALFGITAPWDGVERFEESSLCERQASGTLQAFCALVLLAAWAARAAVVEAVLEAADADQEIMDTMSRRACWACILSGAYQFVFIGWWCSWRTWWARTRYEQYQCPVCNGRSGACSECHRGVVYLNP